MLIELQEPFKSLWDKGYLVQGSDMRRRVHFVKDGVVVSGMSYARYQMSVQLGYIVPDGLEVDHKDDDKTNDTINNYQLLTKTQNRLKQAISSATAKDDEPLYGYECAHCHTRFLIDAQERDKRIKANKTELPFCTHRCSLEYTRSAGISGTPSKDQETIDRIKALRAMGKSSYAIAGELGISRNTVMKYWG